MSTKFAEQFMDVVIHYQFNFGDPRPHDGITVTP